MSSALRRLQCPEGTRDRLSTSIMQDTVTMGLDIALVARRWVGVAQPVNVVSKVTHVQ